MANNNPFMKGPGMNTPTGPIGGMPAPTGSVSMGGDNFEIDLSSVQSNAYTVPDGIYRVKCVEIEQTVSRGGNPMFAWTFEICAGNFSGFQSKSFTALTPAAMWKVAETVEALGVGSQGQVVKFKRSDVINKECGAMFEQSEYNGTVRSSITRVMTLKEMAEALNNK